MYEVAADSEEFITRKYGGFGSEEYSYNKSYGVLDNCTKYNYNVVNDTYTKTNNATKYGYDKYYENVESITVKEGDTQVGQNTFTESGNTSTVSDGKMTYKQTYTPSARSTTVYIQDGTSDVAVFQHEDSGLTQTDTYYGSTTECVVTQYDKYGKLYKKEFVGKNYRRKQ